MTPGSGDQSTQPALVFCMPVEDNVGMALFCGGLLPLQTTGVLLEPLSTKLVRMPAGSSSYVKCLWMGWDGTAGEQLRKLADSQGRRPCRVAATRWSRSRARPHAGGANSVRTCALPLYTGKVLKCTRARGAADDQGGVGRCRRQRDCAALWAAQTAR